MGYRQDQGEAWAVPDSNGGKQVIPKFSIHTGSKVALDVVALPALSHPHSKEPRMESPR